MTPGQIDCAAHSKRWRAPCQARVPTRRIPLPTRDSEALPPVVARRPSRAPSKHGSTLVRCHTTHPSDGRTARPEPSAIFAQSPATASIPANRRSTAISSAPCANPLAHRHGAHSRRQLYRDATTFPASAGRARHRDDRAPQPRRSFPCGPNRPRSIARGHDCTADAAMTARTLLGITGCRGAR